MADKRDDITETNEEADAAFTGHDAPATKTLEEAETLEEVNEAADAKFNDEERKPGIGNMVGGLRGGSD